MTEIARSLPDLSYWSTAVRERADPGVPGAANAADRIDPMSSLAQILMRPGVFQEPPAEEVVLKRARLRAPEALTVFYGETYDTPEITLDSLKYYLAVSRIAKSTEYPLAG